MATVVKTSPPNSDINILITIFEYKIKKICNANQLFCKKYYPKDEEDMENTETTYSYELIKNDSIDLYNIKIQIAITEPEESYEVLLSYSPYSIFGFDITLYLKITVDTIAIQSIENNVIIPIIELDYYHIFFKELIELFKKSTHKERFNLDISAIKLNNMPL